MREILNDRRFQSLIELRETDLTLTIKFSEPARISNKELMAEFLQRLLSAAKVINFKFLLPKQDGGNFEFFVDKNSAASASAAKNGTISFNLNDREVLYLSRGTGQRDNRTDHKAIIYCFTLGEKQENHLTIFFIKHLEYCQIEKL